MKLETESVPLSNYPDEYEARLASFCGNCTKKTCVCDRTKCIEPSGCEDCQTLVTKWDDNNCCKIKDTCKDPCDYKGITYAFGDETSDSTVCRPCVCTEKDGKKQVVCTDKSKAPYCDLAAPICAAKNDQGFKCQLVDDGFADMDNCCPMQKC
jgi:hypothetical protein